MHQMTDEAGKVTVMSLLRAAYQEIPANEEHPEIWPFPKVCLLFAIKALEAGRSPTDACMFSEGTPEFEQSLHAPPMIEASVPDIAA